MATKASKLLLLALSLLLVSSTLARRGEGKQERRLQECRQRCSERGQDPSQRLQCERQCQQRYEEEQRPGRGREEESLNPRRQDPERRLEECRRECRQGRQGQQERGQCEQECQQRYEEEQGRQRDEVSPRHQDPERRREECRRDCREGRQGQQERGQCEQECQQRYEEECRRQRDEVNPRRQDPERCLEECRHECRQGRQGEQERKQCEQECQQRYEEKQRRQRDDVDPRRQDPERRLQECQQECSERHQGRRHEQVQCQRQCQQRYEEEQRQRRERDDANPRREEEEEGEETRAGQNPYVFQSESFRHRVRTEHGNIRVLQNFAQKSKLLVGIANYRIVMLEANPNTFVVPTHLDAEVVIYVVRGEGTITKIRGNQDRESHDIKQGDVLKISAGTVVYLINKSNNQKLQLAKILQPVSTPGQSEDFQTVGGDNPESYYRVFSTEILEAALNRRKRWAEISEGEGEGVEEHGVCGSHGAPGARSRREEWGDLEVDVLVGVNAGGNRGRFVRGRDNVVSKRMERRRREFGVREVRVKLVDEVFWREAGGAVFVVRKRRQRVLGEEGGGEEPPARVDPRVCWVLRGCRSGQRIAYVHV
ncbi:uncharacterized protein A4U43_C03F5250 [Asparagus officinalis]|uniref:Cupin type-1 domain-containing protein n=1 Tax=Asparagus officinalis TaxID=4686 RepID=A0A5P1F832_ASPOF|nr:uncharacterized protein A4U43_C03F5250 [Asparagus officinalis]